MNCEEIRDLVLQILIDLNTDPPCAYRKLEQLQSLLDIPDEAVIKGIKKKLDQFKAEPNR